jgi:hypothetical protein
MKNLITALILLAVFPARAELWMPSIFGSGMVLQAD